MERTGYGYNSFVSPWKKFLIIFALALFKIAGYPIYMNEIKAQVLGVSTVSAEKSDSLKNPVTIETITAFDQKEFIETQIIPFETKYEKDSEMEYGKEEVLQEGINGTKYLTYLVTFWQDDEIDRQLLRTEVEEPTEEIIAKGTKIVWRLLEGTEYGRLKYWYKLRVWATKYDAKCIGCTGRTYSGTEVKQGVCATDPKVIPLGTNFYVPGYGVCRAEDIGGAIKGNKIDLGYADASKGSWRTKWVDIYLLTNAPE